MKQVFKAVLLQTVLLIACNCANAGELRVDLFNIPSGIYEVQVMVYNKGQEQAFRSNSIYGAMYYKVEKVSGRRDMIYIPTNQMKHGKQYAMAICYTKDNTRKCAYPIELPGSVKPSFDRASVYYDESRIYQLQAIFR